ncbi:hypothetical protein [Hymenobacter sp. PAMC 26628]|uniref:hypothetical protein n=1 Tax=Hymenobacter sp. PAMC 26628 TaxID=1484118 RepID=UPI0007700EA7|nr:hypothetical protein [Hymenobacter sp. PAMC 26628]AMJ65827.1 hypothetical protein AXW84_10590 [Hymenobacter sp. PAMC 26628]
MKYVLFLALALVLGVVASGRHWARVHRAARAAPVVVRKSAWATGRPKTVRAVPPGPRPQL